MLLFEKIMENMGMNLKWDSLTWGLFSSSVIWSDYIASNKKKKILSYEQKEKIQSLANITLINKCVYIYSDSNPKKV
jgi:hypothetical protein